MNSLKQFLSIQILSSLLMVFILCPISMAQGFGIKGGLCYSDQDYEYDIPSFDFDRLSQSGVTAGFFISYDIWLLSSLRLELDYVQKGSSIEVYVTDESSPVITGVLRIDDRLDYLSLNVLLTPGFFSNSSIAPYLVAGPRADILLNTSSEIPSLVFDNLRPIIVGATVGLGISVPLTHSTSLLFEGVYNYDFTYAYDKDVLKIKNNSALFTTGLSF